jgi:hypothetical protein
MDVTENTNLASIMAFLRDKEGADPKQTTGPFDRRAPTTTLGELGIGRERNMK